MSTSSLNARGSGSPAASAAPNPTKQAPWTLYSIPGWGSVLAEVVLTLAGIPYEREVDIEDPGLARQAFLQKNPLGQLPTALLPNGHVLTESAAFVLVAHDAAPEAGLVPPEGSPERVDFFRWLAFFVAALYPTFTYGDDPGRWVKTASQELRDTTDEQRKKLWRQLEGVAGSPWFLGDRFSALDIYVGVMTRWRPRRAHFAEHCPRLHAIAERFDALPAVKDVLAANFG